MDKRYFYVRLIPPRPTFVSDMTPEERLLMQQHSAYIREEFLAGKLLIYGPVMASDGPFGMAVFEAPDEAAVRHVLDNDPTVKAGLNCYEVSPMQVAAARAKEA